MFKTYLQMPLENLFTNILLETRQISDGIQKADVFASAMERACYLRDLAMLSGNRWIDTDSLRNLDPLIELFRKELDVETIAVVPVFHGHNDPDLGAVGWVEECRELTDRGKTMSLMLQSLRRLRCMIEVADARVKAENFVNRRLQV